MMEVYHTSNQCVSCPDTAHSRKELDFGPGFYFTTIRHQAEVYAFRFLRRNEPAWLNVYEFSEEWTDWKVKLFKHYDEEWLDFVMTCRNGEVVGDFDLIVGGIADDKVFDTIDLYTDALISKEEALKRLSYMKPNIQYCIRTDSMLEQCLTFKEVIQLCPSAKSHDK